VDLQDAIDDQGRLRSEVLFADPARGFSLRILAGTLALTADRRPLRSITAHVLDDHPVVSDEQALLGQALEFEPSGATFNPPIRISLAYDPRSVPDGFTDSDLDLAYFDTSRGQWVSHEGGVEPANATVSTSVAHFTSFAVITRAPPSVNWLVIVGILALELGLALGAYMYIIRRRAVLATTSPGDYFSVTHSVVIAGALPPPRAVDTDKSIEHAALTEEDSIQ
jgi:hypothetical protein